MANGECKQIRKKIKREREKESDNFLALLPPVQRKEGNKKKGKK